MVAKRNTSPSDTTFLPEGFDSVEQFQAWLKEPPPPMVRTSLDIQTEAFHHLEEEILLALQSPYPRLELAKVARWNQVNPELIEQVAQSLLKRRTGQDLEKLEFESVIGQLQKLELEEPDAGLREWKLQAIARRVKRTPRQLMDAYNKALCQQKPVKPMTVKEFREKQEQEVTWLVQGWIPKGSTLLLHADGGVGKTLFAYQILESVLSGSPWNGYQVHQGNCLLVQVDEPELVTAERIDIRGIRDDAPLGILSEWQVEQMANLEATIEATKPSFVIVDSLTAINRHCIFSENDTEYARPILQLAAIASKHNCTILIVHHSNADGNARGTRAIHNSVSEVWGMSVADGGDRLLRVQKTRLGRPPGRYKFAFDDDDFSFHYQGEDSGEEAEATATHEDRVRLWLHEDDRRGIRYTTLEVAEFLAMTKHCARRACYELWAKGLIKRVRPKGERTYLYYSGDVNGIDPLPINISTCDHAITSDHDPAITSNTMQGEGLNGMRSCDHEKTKNIAREFLNSERSHDRIPLNASSDAEQSVIASSDRMSDRKGQTGDRVIASVTPTGTPEVLQVGDIVIANATATWHRSGSDKLPWREVRSSDKQAAQIQINNVTATLFEELIGPSKVLEFSRDGERVKVRNQTTGRTSIFSASDVRILKKGEATSK